MNKEDRLAASIKARLQNKAREDNDQPINGIGHVL